MFVTRHASIPGAQLNQSLQVLPGGTPGPAGVRSSRSARRETGEDFLVNDPDQYSRVSSLSPRSMIGLFTSHRHEMPLPAVGRSTGDVPLQGLLAS